MFSMPKETVVMLLFGVGGRK